MTYRSDVKSETKAKIQSVSQKITIFCSQILQNLDYNLAHCQVIFLASTIGRVHRIEKVMRPHHGHLETKIHSCDDGNSIEGDKDILSADVHLVVGTPMHVSDLLCTQNQSLSPKHIKMVILNEADEMLSARFNVQVFYFAVIFYTKFSMICTCLCLRFPILL